MGISDESRDTIGPRNMVASGLLDLNGAVHNRLAATAMVAMILACVNIVGMYV